LQCFDQHVQYNNAAFNNLLACMFKNGCMSQMHGDWPSPDNCDQTKPQAAAVPNFNLSILEGRWYITRGLSDEFDTYPCQVACGRRVAADRVNFSIWYQIPLDDGTMLPQVSNQSFSNPDHSTPAHLRQDAWMDGQDNWYVIAAKPDTYWLVKYCGTSATWDGYGGAFLYTRTPTMDEALEPELRAAATKAGFDWDRMKVTSNVNCGIEPTPQYGCPVPREDYLVV
jgi:violaxanthin de-epoxidase